MRRIAVRILVALMTFAMGLLVFAIWHGPRLRDCVIEFPADAENEIARTVFRYNIQQLLSAEDSAIYFLSENDDRDAREEVLMSLQREGLPVRRLSQLGMNDVLSRDCYNCPHGSSEFILRLGKIRWLNDNEVLVGGSCRRWYLNADRAYLYHVVLEGNRWVVKHYELL